MNDKPFVHLLDTLQGTYAYDVNTNIVLTLEPHQAEYLEGLARDGRPPESDGGAGQWYAGCRAQGFFSSHMPSRIVHPSTRYIQDLVAGRLSSICLQVTQQCNLRCSYCVYSGAYQNRTHSRQVMSPEVAIAAVDWFLAHSYESTHLNVGFYGGEPLLNMSLIERVVDYVRGKAVGRELSCTLTTNGTLLNERNASYLARNGFNLVISLDGPRWVHDSGRRYPSGAGSYDTLLEGIRNVYGCDPEYARSKMSVNAVVDPAGGCFDDVVSFFDSSEEARDFIHVAATILDDTKRPSPGGPFHTQMDHHRVLYLLSRAGRLAPSSPSRLVRAWEDGFLDRMRRILGTPWTGLGEELHHSGPCVPSMKRLFVSTSGALYPCERIDERAVDACIGSVDNGVDCDAVERMLNVGRLTEEECKRCWALAFCTLCVRSCLASGRLDRPTKLAHCGDVRARAHSDLRRFLTMKEMCLA